MKELLDTSPLAQLNREMARHEWDAADRRQAASLEYTIRFAVEALKAPAIINAAGLAAFLGFVSANPLASPNAVEQASETFMYFLMGLILAAAATASAYFAQLYFTGAHSEITKQWERPYVVDNNRWVHLTVGRICQILAIAFVFGSYILFYAGGTSFLYLIKSVTAT